MNSREIILKNLKKAVAIRSDIPDEKQDAAKLVLEGVKAQTPGDLDGLWQQFQKELEKVSGEFFRFKSISDLAKKFGELLQETGFKTLVIDGNPMGQKIAGLMSDKVPGLEIMDAAKLSEVEKKEKMAQPNAGLLDPAYAIADIGSIAIFRNETPSLLAHLLPECIFVFVQENLILGNLFEFFDKEPSERTKSTLFVTGPSRTADVEKILILGAHGPKRFIVGTYRK